MKQSVYKVLGMDCVEEVKALRAELDGKPGVEELSFDLLNAKMTVRHDVETITPKEIENAVSRAGLRAQPWQESHANNKNIDVHWQRSALLAASALSLLSAYLLHGLEGGWLEALAGETHTAPLPSILLYISAIVAGGWFVAPKAFGALRRLRPDMNLLMAIAVIGAVLIGEWFEAATVTFLFALSLLLESWSISRARRAVTALMATAPPKARTYCSHDKQFELIDVDRIAPGTTIYVRPGERIPLDGIVIKGSSDVNESMLTGESSLVLKSIDSEVFAGTVNEDGALEIKTEKTADDTMLARIIRLVSEAQSRRSPSEQWVDKFAVVYTPVVMILALIVMVIPPLTFAWTWGDSFYRALVLLVIACPCALVISTPVSVVAALASAAHNGVLVKGGVALEAPAHLRAIAFDKTGTLTTGRHRVVSVSPVSGFTAEKLLSVAASIEQHSEHPLARAIIDYANQYKISFSPVSDFQAIRGKGAVCKIEGEEVWIGSPKMIKDMNFDHAKMDAFVKKEKNRAVTVIAVGNRESVFGIISLSDEPQKSARNVIRALKRNNITPYMVTGDSIGSANRIGRMIGLRGVYAQLLPEEKMTVIERLIRRHEFVAMAGDGINDAPALAASSLGIAMGVAGTDAALETAHVALMKDDLTKIPWLIGHSRRMLSVIRQNIFFALTIKALFVFMAFAGLATLWAAIAADMGVSLLVVFNAMRLLK